MHSVTGCQFQDNGNRRVWFFRDNSQVVELLSVPLKLRFNYYDASNRNVLNDLDPPFPDSFCILS